MITIQGNRTISLFFFTLSFLFSVSVMSQSQEQNYIMTRTMLDSCGSRSIPGVQYYDGLGRPTVSVSVLSGNGNTVSSLISYDNKGREESVYLPVPSGRSMSYKSPDEFITASSSFYDGDNTAYSRNRYDVFDRVVSTGLPGAEWRSGNKQSRTVYSVNTQADNVLYYDAPIDQNSLTKPEATGYTYYPAGSLTKEISYDADGRSLTVFRDLYDNKILERSETGDTYYVYDGLGRLRFVLMPMYQKSGNKSLFAYEYRYDGHGRLVKKILPGCEYIQYWYDRDGYLLYMQDSNLRERGRYRFMLYDNLGRLAVQGLCTDCKRNETISSIVKCNWNQSGVLNTCYVLASDIIENPTLELVNYYDNYSFLPKNHTFHNISLSTASVKAVGQLTGSVVLASNGEYICTAMAYDTEGNVTETMSRHLGYLMEHTYNKYSFTNNLLESSSDVSVGYGEKFHAVTTNTYNTCNDKIETSETAVEHGHGRFSSTICWSYDDLGRVKEIARPFSGTGDDGKIVYEYDMRGWTKSISSGSFKEWLYYADGIGTPCYNGNISSMKWQNNDYGQTRGYKFVYDSQNRLTEAIYGERDGLDNRTDRYNEYLEYDANGNITRIQRRGLKQDKVYGKIDNLHLSYRGNMLSGASDDAEDIFYEGAFNYDGQGGVGLFTYNGNGALTSDSSRGIAMIEYDACNMPLRIQFTNGNVTKYVYSATGQKLRTVHYTAAPNITVEIGTTHELSDAELLHKDSTDYLMNGNLTLTDGRIDKYLFPGGYCQATGSGTICIAKPQPSFWEEDDGSISSIPSYDYQAMLERWRAAVAAEEAKDGFAFYYYNQDHLGNIREVVDEKGNVCQVTNYYPFGTPYCDSISVSGSTLQPYKYNGKELDLMHGLNTYDYGARQLNPVLCAWDRME